MAATEHLSAALFHGTLHSFLEGDVIAPTDVEHTETPHAYATVDLKHAQDIAEIKARMHNRRNPDDPREPLVYEVEHMSGPADIWDLPSRRTTAADPVGFRVKRRADG